jgi:hypothetical protein
MSTAGIDVVFSIAMPAGPYPGLRPFEKDEWAIFFGRERMADAVVDELIAKRLLVVHGDSGSGKSSLIRAGVLPRLEQESARGGIRWRTCAVTPGEAPLWNLAKGLAALRDPSGPRDDDIIEIRRALNFGRNAPAAIAALLSTTANDQVCVLIDQFEELFAHAGLHGPEEALLVSRFLSALHAAPPDGLCAVLTMRSEFLGACARYGDLAEVVNATQYLLPRMRHEDLLRAIREPAGLFDGEVSRELADRLIADAGGGQDHLPLIQHGLMVLSREHAARSPSGTWKLDVEAYTRTGGLRALLSGHADAVMRQAEKALGDRAGRLVEDLFRAITDINAQGQGLRRPQSLAQLVAVTGAGESAVRTVVDAFRAEGVSLLRPYGQEPIESTTLIDISHEALIRGWDRMADIKDGWLAREFRNGLVWRALLVQADSFDRDPSNVLAPATTDEREKWMQRRNAAWAARYGGGWNRVQALLRASIEARDRARAEQREARRREEESRLRDQRLRFFQRGGAVLLLLLVAAIYFWYQAQQDKAEAQQSFESANAAWATSERLRNEWAKQAEQQSAELQRLVNQLKSTTPGGKPAPVDTKTAREISQLAYQISSAAPATRNIGARVYVHITDEKLRAAAAAFERALEGKTLNGAKVVVPGIELVSASPPGSVLRCFQKEDCDEAVSLLQLIEQVLAEPRLKIQDLSGRYSSSKNIRGRHFEIWFAPGPITLRDRQSAS